ncbi:MAG: hypothetical protein HY332_16635 [Chloroflexi bacterium]|nr:hypothetical protein [Chloroflexota bacterium]
MAKTSGAAEREQGARALRHADLERWQAVALQEAADAVARLERAKAWVAEAQEQLAQARVRLAEAQLRHDIELSRAIAAQAWQDKIGRELEAQRRERRGAHETTPPPHPPSKPFRPAA